jgi:hypothetical protein
MLHAQENKSKKDEKNSIEDLQLFYHPSLWFVLFLEYA